MSFQLPNLPYEYNALEPFIDQETMKLHHGKHHQAYLDNLNKALEGYPELQEKTIEELLTDIDQVDEKIRQVVINHGGGHANHSFFWEILCPASDSGTPEGELLEAINSSFESLDSFKEQFNAKAMGVFGSGWAFLIMDKNKKLKLKRKSFQNSPLMDNCIPILGIDVWEHSYYLQYQNRRAEYLSAFWNIVNWKKVAENFTKALQ